MSTVNESRSSLRQHFLALRKMFLFCLGAVLVAFLVLFYFFRQSLMDFILAPIVARGVEVIYTVVSEAIVTQLKVCLIAGVIVASPFIFWQIWTFLKPALYPHERRAFRLLFLSALILFILGVIFCYVAVYSIAIDFFLISGTDIATPMLSVDKYVGFLVGFVVPFGLAFLLPVALFITTRLGLTSYETLKPKRKYIVLAVVTIAAILTPPDVVSQISLAVPMLLLFELGLQISRLTKKRMVEKDEEAEEEGVQPPAA